MIRFLGILIFILWFTYLGEAQIIPGIGTLSKQITYIGKIVDAETGEALPFAQINHIYKYADKDSLIVRNLVADKDGKFEFQSPRVMNNRIEVICLGYKIQTRMLSEAGNRERIDYGQMVSNRSKQQTQIYDQVDLGVLKLIPDVQQLDEVVVKARIKLFEMSGDTLMVFPKNIKQFEGETLADILKRLPNFYVDEQGNIYVNGKKIERAMLNDKHIFGENVKTMVTSIMAKEAGLIKVYDEIDETDEILQGKEFARKRRVMNVITFKDFNLFKGGEAYLEGGMYADKDVDSKQQTMHNASGRIGQYAANFRIALEGNTKEIALPQRKQETGVGINAEVSSTDLLKSIGVDYNFDKNEQEQESRTEQFYFPSAYFESQMAEQSNSNLQNRNVHKFELNGKYIKKMAYSLLGGYSGTIEESALQSLSLSNMTKDEKQLSYLQQARETSKQDYNHMLKIKITSSLGELSAIQLLLDGVIAKKSEDGIRLDTNYAEGIANKQIFSVSGDRPEYRISSKLYYNKNFRKFSLGYDPEVDYNQTDQHYFAIDRLTGEIDSITSRNQIQKNLKISNSVSGDLIIKNKHRLGISTIYNIYKFQLEECFPVSLSVDKIFRSWTGDIYLDLFNKFRLSLSKSDNLFPLQYLSTRLRDNNPMELSTGNASLKMGKDYTFSCNIFLKDILHANLRYQIIIDPILLSRRYFETNTLLSEYGDYEVLAGAVLTTPINAKNYNTFMLYATSATKRGAMLFKFQLNYEFQNPETDLLGDIARSYMHSTNGRLSMISNFSSTFRLDITDRLSYNHTKIKADKLQKNNRISNSLMCKANLNLFYRMMVNADYTYDYNYNSRSKKTNNIHSLNASVNYRIFSNRKGVISFNAYNLFYAKSSLKTTSTDIYIQNTFKPENSTLFSLSFRYKFGAEQ